MIGEQLHRWGFVPHVVRDVFRTTDGGEIEAILDAFCADVLGAGIASHELFDASSGSVHGVRLADGRRVLVKARRVGTNPQFLGAVQDVQRHLLARGFPAPAPLLGPTPLGAGIAVVESFVDEGERRDPHDTAVRATMARGLAALVELCEPLRVDEALVRGDGRTTGGLWPVPHDARFDFAGSAAGAEWIDDIAARAKQRLGAAERGVIGHGDWRAENMRFAGDHIAVVFDWDSLRVAPEPHLVGAAAHYFTSDFRVDDRRQLPTLDEALAFVDDYEAARGLQLDRDVVHAAIIYGIAYAARCEHSDAVTEFGRAAPRPVPTGDFADASARAFLARHAETLL